MTCKILAICDSEGTYSDLLSKQLLRMPGNGLEVRNFTQMEKLITFSREKPITYAILSDQYHGNHEGLDALAYYYLVNSKEEELKDDGCNYIYRYQAIGEIYQKITGVVTEVKALGNGLQEIKRNKSSFRMLGVYNPVHGNGQTTFARGLAKIIGKTEDKVFYLNLEEFVDEIEKIRNREILTEGKGDLGDLIYYLKQNADQAKDQIHTLVHQGKYYDTIAPMPLTSELCSVQYKEWLRVMDILKVCEYTTVVFDLHSCVQGYLEILESCDKLYVPQLTSYMNHQKYNNYQRYIKLIGKNRILIKAQEIQLPVYTEEVDKSVELYISTLLREGE